MAYELVRSFGSKVHGEQQDECCKSALCGYRRKQGYFISLKILKVNAHILIKFDRNFLKLLLVGEEILKVCPKNKKFAYLIKMTQLQTNSWQAIRKGGRGGVVRVHFFMALNQDVPGKKINIISLTVDPFMVKLQFEIYIYLSPEPPLPRYLNACFLEKSRQVKFLQ